MNGMNEFVYVLGVEALIFWLVAVVLVSRRLDIVDWPMDETWPVFGSSLLLSLAYAWILVFLCAVIIASQLREVTAEVCEAFARAAGRIVTMQGMLVLYVSVFVWLSPRNNWAILLCQLWDTSCNASKVGRTFWSMSYSVYMAILLPILAVMAGLVLVVSNMCKNEPTLHARRSILTNGVFVLILSICSTLKRNFQLGCEGGEPGCRVKNFPVDNTTLFDLNPGPVYVSSSPILFTVSGFLVSDLLVDVLNGLMLIHEHKTALKVGVTVVRAVQLSVVPLLVFALDMPLPWQLAWGHFAFAAVMALADSVQIWMSKNESYNMNDADVEVEDNASISATTGMNINSTPFSLEPTKRRRFLLSRTRFPVAVKPRLVSITKKRE